MINLEMVRGVLNSLREIHPETYLAGGAPRDWTLGRIPHDYDFYIPYSRYLESLLPHFLVSRFGGRWTPYDGSHIREPYRAPNLGLVVYGRIGNLEVQVMLVHTNRRQTLEEFTMNASRISWDGEFHITEDFMEFTEGRLTYREDQAYRSQPYIDKISTRFDMVAEPVYELHNGNFR